MIRMVVMVKIEKKMMLTTMMDDVMVQMVMNICSVNDRRVE
jgi:hypothetical protein